MDILKRKIKNSLFIFLFQIKHYLLEAYKALHPEDTTVTENDIQILTLDAVLATNGIYNNLAFLVRQNRLIVMKSQSVWSKNIIYRLWHDGLDTLLEYQLSEQTDLYGSKPLKLPNLEFYVLYTGYEKVPDKLSLSELCMEERSGLDICASVISQEEDNVIGEYIRLCHILDEQRKKCGSTSNAIQTALKICKEENVLMQYLQGKEEEVRSILLKLWDEEKALKIDSKAVERAQH